MIESSASLHSSPEHWPTGIFTLTRPIVLFHGDGAMGARRILDQNVHALCWEIVSVGARHEGVSLAGTEQLLISEERGKRLVPDNGRVAFGRRMRVDPGDNFLGLCGGEKFVSAGHKADGSYYLLSSLQILSPNSDALERISWVSMNGL